TPGGASAPPANRTVLRYGVYGADVQTVDPHYAATTQDRNVVDMVYNGLIRYKPGQSDEFEPDLAEELPEPQTENGKQVWTFKLRRGVMWHSSPKTDRYELTADDVVYSYQKAADSKTSGYSGDYAGVTVEKVDDYTVKFTVDPPLSKTLFYPKVANYQGGFVMSKKVVEALGLDAMKTTPVGTGPFMLKSYSAKDRMELAANDQYFRGAPKLAGVQVRYMADASSRELALRTGEMDVISGVPDSTWVKKMNQEANLQADVFGVGESVVVHLNMARPPLNDLRVRQAIFYAIDRDAHAGAFGGEPVVTNIYSSVPVQLEPGGLTKEEAQAAGVLYGKDVNKAKQLLAEAGVSNLTLDVVTSEREDYRKNFEVLQQELAEIGITLNVNVVDHPTYHSLIRQDKNPIVVYVAFRPNADVILTQFYLSDSIVVSGKKPVTNFSHYDKIDDLILQARQETDPKKQEEIWKQANIKILQDAAAFPLHFINQVVARSKAVDYGHPLKAVLNLYPQFTEQTTVKR
ncbi:MAG: polyamine ABC transporter substrate-binding protein, partial [Thermomicrobiaceae bacterium]|nr:polyamine ABC transporter substrate-binding protein [Thermomicrobiaceae bacterium]